MSLTPLSVKRESFRHSLILDVNGKWVATVNTEIADAEAVKNLIEEMLKAKAPA
jgi:hypothetical protein